MKIKEQLLVAHSKENTRLITAYIGDSKERLRELMDCFFGNEYRLSQRAAMVVSHCFDERAEMMQPYLEKLILNLENEAIHIAVIRNTVRILQFTAIPEKLQARLFDKCLLFLADTQMPIAVKAFSMTVLLNICKCFPDLKVEVIPLIEDVLKYTESAGVKNRGKKVLTQLYKL